MAASAVEEREGPTTAPPALPGVPWWSTTSVRAITGLVVFMALLEVLPAHRSDRPTVRASLQ